MLHDLRMFLYDVRDWYRAKVPKWLPTWLKLAFVCVIAGILLSVCFGCAEAQARKPKVDTVYITVHDTVFINRVVTVTDTLWRVDTLVIAVDTVRDTVVTVDTTRTTDTLTTVDTVYAKAEDYTPDPSAIAELPRVWLDTKMPAISRTVPVTCSTLQGALNAASDGDALTLPAGSVCSGHFTYSLKRNAVILTTATTLPPEGVRVTPQSASTFAVLETNNSQPALDVKAFASGLRVVGISFRAALTNKLTYALVNLGPVVHSADSLAHDITLDRVYMQGHDSLQLQRCVTANAARVAILDSYLAGCHYKGADAQAVIAWNSPGPLKIVNNYLEGSGENVLFGGADPSIPNLIASDIEFRRNWLRKPDSWRDSTGFNPWTEKNILELKSARRVLIEGNVLEGSWPDGQTGFALWIKSANQSGHCDWCGSSDVVFRWNRIIKATAGIAVTRGEAYSGGTYDPVHNVDIHDIQMDSVGTRDLVTSRRLIYLSGDMAGISVAHVTSTDGGNYHALTLGGAAFTSGVFRDNLLTSGNYGVVCDGKGFGATALTNCWGGTFAGNVLEGKATGASQGTFPAGNIYPATLPYTGTAGVDRAELAKRLAGVR